MDSDALLALAHAEGFDLAGIAPVAPPPGASRFEAWLEAGHHGSMDYLERQRERILDPRGILPGGKSMLVVGLAHSRPAVRLADGARIARYAAGRDYHNVLGKKLRKLARRLQAEGVIGRGRTIVDAGPLLERSHAEVAGVGFASKAANLLHPDFGPWFFLGEALLDIELEPTSSPPAGSCGTCTACLDACPTAAILEPGRVDARRCISYQTIENRGAIPHELRQGIGEWAFGCDVCSEVCPWGDRAPDLSERFGQHPGLAGPTGPASDLVSWIEAGDTLDEHLAGSPLRRAKRTGLARNAAIVLGNRPSEAGRRTLLRALSFDPSALVREAAAWGLRAGHGDDPRARAAVEQAAGRDPDETARRGMRRTLEGP